MQGTLMAGGEQSSDAQGGTLRSTRFACALSVQIRGWDRRAGTWGGAYSSRTRDCYSLQEFAMLYARSYGPMREGVCECPC